MASLCFSARSRSKCQNPIPVQTQKRLLSMGGPPEVTAAVCTPDIIDDSYQKGMRVKAVCVHCTEALMLCCIHISEKMLAELRGNNFKEVLLRLFGSELIQ